VVADRFPLGGAEPKLSVVLNVGLLIGSARPDDAKL
jgi:hypothetical protein